MIATPLGTLDSLQLLKSSPQGRRQTKGLTDEGIPMSGFDETFQHFE